MKDTITVEMMPSELANIIYNRYDEMDYTHLSGGLIIVEEIMRLDLLEDDLDRVLSELKKTLIERMKSLDV